MTNILPTLPTPSPAFRASLTYPRKPVDTEGATHYTIFIEGWPYSLGHLKRNADGTWLPYCFGRREIGYHDLDWPTCATREEAFALIRQRYEAALARYHAASAKAAGFIAQGLSPVEYVHGPHKDAEDFRIKVLLIFSDDEFGGGQIAGWSCAVYMTVAEALTAMDTMFSRTGEKISAHIDGIAFRYEGKWMETYAGWTIPAGSRDYHVAGWRSRSGLGRYGTAAA